MSTYEQIVRELADSDPILDVGGIEESHIVCVWCAAGHDSDGFRVDYSLRAGQQEELVRSDHRPDCLWIRARRAVEFNGTGGVMHAKYDQKTGTFPCCGKTPDETAVNDLMTLDPVNNPATCSGAKS
jgi:hypothetical protein